MKYPDYLAQDGVAYIVRCKDCSRHSTRIPNAHGWLTCERTGKYVCEMGFCYWGEGKRERYVREEA